MGQGGFSISVDRRWIVAVPGNDVAFEVRHQLGGCPAGVEEDEWSAVTADVTSMFSAALAEGNALAAAFLVREADGEWALARADFEFVDGRPSDIGVVYDALVESHRDDEYAAEVSMIETPNGVGVRVRQIVSLTDGTQVERAGYVLPAAESALLVRAFSNSIGWAEVWVPSLESMVLTVRQSDETPAGALQLVEYQSSEVS